MQEANSRWRRLAGALRGSVCVVSLFAGALLASAAPGQGAQPARPGASSVKSASSATKARRPSTPASRLRDELWRQRLADEAHARHLRELAKDAPISDEEWHAEEHARLDGIRRRTIAETHAVRTDQRWVDEFVALALAPEALDAYAIRRRYPELEPTRCRQSLKRYAETPGMRLMYCQSTLEFEAGSQMTIRDYQADSGGSAHLSLWLEMPDGGCLPLRRLPASLQGRPVYGEYPPIYHELGDAMSVAAFGIDLGPRSDERQRTLSVIALDVDEARCYTKIEIIEWSMNEQR